MYLHKILKKQYVRTILLVTILVIIAITYSLLYILPNKTSQKLPSISIDVVSANGLKHPVSIQLAKTAHEREVGLMYVTHMDLDAGMFFVFPYSQYQAFWMKNTKIPLDILYIDEHLQIVDIKIDTPICLNESCPSYTSLSPAMYVLEVNSGWSSVNDIKVGDRLSIDPNILLPN